jgi:hypothetical protein
MTESTLTRHDLEAKIVKRCWEDEAFRKEFTADPKGTFVKFLQIPAASLPSISVHQEESGSWHIVLPAKPANTSELSEPELEKVAGGVAVRGIWDPRWLGTVPGSIPGEVGISTGSAQPISLQTQYW